MQLNPVEHEQKGKDEKEADAKVLAYLSDCGLDTSVISVDDIDDKSLAFLSQWAEKDTSAEESRVPTLDDPLHELQDLHCGQTAGISENSSGENQGSRRGHFEEALGQEKTSNRESSSSFDEIISKFHSLSRAHLELEQLNLLSSSLRAMAPVARQTTQEATIDTSEHNDKEEELDLEALEPWQRVLFQKMDKQTKAIEKCQNQIDVLTSIVAINIVTAKDSFSHTSANATRESQSIQPSPASNGVNQQLQAQIQPQLPNQPQISQLWTILDKVYHIPRNIYAYILSTRPIRVLLLIQCEANNFDMGHPNNQRFIDIHLMMKLAFICMFLRARIGNNEQRGAARKTNQKRGGAGVSPLDFLGEMVSLWRSHSAELLMVASVIVYFIQTGLIVFLYNVIFKENVIAKVWRNEDLEDVNVGENDMGGAGANHINYARDGENVLDRGRRRGRRDRMPQAANEENPVIAHEGENENQGQGHAQEPLNPPQNQILRGVANFQPNINIDNTFVGGVLDPPFQLNGDEERVRNAPREEIFLGHMIDGMKDVLYLVGSFFLSFFPMWRPRVRELVREEGNDNVRRGLPEQNDGHEAIRADVAQNGQDDANENAEDAPDGENEEAVDDRLDNE